MIGTPEGQKKYYVSDVQETLNALTGKQAFAKIYERK